MRGGRCRGGIVSLVPLARPHQTSQPDSDSRDARSYAAAPLTTAPHDSMTVLTTALDTGKMSVCHPSPSEPEVEEKQRTVWRFLKKIFTSQILKPNRIGSTKRNRIPPLRRESFYLSTASLEKRRPSEVSVDTVITLLEELDNKFNEKIERG